MQERIVPVLRVKDVTQAMEWYARLGFQLACEESASPDFRAHATIQRKGLFLLLTERADDGQPESLVHVYTNEDVTPIAEAFGVNVTALFPMRQVELRDPDGNRIRILSRAPSLEGLRPSWQRRQ